MAIPNVTLGNRASLAFLFDRVFFSEQISLVRPNSDLSLNEFGEFLSEKEDTPRFYYDYKKGDCIGLIMEGDDNAEAPVLDVIKRHKGTFLYDGLLCDGGYAFQVKRDNGEVIIELGVVVIGGSYTPYVKIGGKELRANEVSTTSRVRFLVSFSETEATIYFKEQAMGSVSYNPINQADFSSLVFGNTATIHGRLVYWPAPIKDPEIFAAEPGETESPLFNGAVEWDMTSPSPALSTNTPSHITGVEWDMTNPSPTLNVL